MSMVAGAIVWTKTIMKIFCATKKKKVNVPFCCLNLADLYNQKMGHVDVGDQLSKCCRFEHWMQKKEMVVEHLDVVCWYALDKCMQYLFKILQALQD